MQVSELKLAQGQAEQVSVPELERAPQERAPILGPLVEEGLEALLFPAGLEAAVPTP